MNAGRELATEEIREQKAIIAAMSARIAALEAELAKERELLAKCERRVRHFAGCPAQLANRYTCDCGATQIEDEITTLLTGAAQC